MALTLSPHDRARMSGSEGQAVATALRIVVETAEMLGADLLTPIVSAHIDGCLWHGESTTLFAEHLVALGAKIGVGATLNVGALDLLHAGRVRLDPTPAASARRLMSAYLAMGCRATWTCSPYQAGHRPAFGEHVAWGESNAVAFCNSVLGARTNRYGDFLDICAAISGRAPLSGLHLDDNRRARILVDVRALQPEGGFDDSFYPILGAWLGREAGSTVAAIDGLGWASEDQLKALGAAAASTGAVGLFHAIGRTPEAPDVSTAMQGAAPEQVIVLRPGDLDAARSALSTASIASGDPIDAVAIGSPHLSAAELDRLAAGLAGRPCSIPFYACTGRHVLAERADVVEGLERLGVVVVVDTCIVVTPILPGHGGVLMTNSGKFAHYGKGATGYDIVFGALDECIESAVCGRLVIGQGTGA